MELNPEDERPHIAMSPADKDKINAFSRHLARKNDLKRRIARRKKLIQLHDDASDELLLLDDDAPVHYNIGDVFILDEKDAVDQSLQNTISQLNEDVEQYHQQVSEIEQSMTELKAALYAKFGKTINLEE
ncbi:unnamed protein product [Agarophyton chilense]